MQRAVISIENKRGLQPYILMVLVHLLDIMPNVSSRYDGLGVGFAPYLQPPGPEVVRWTVGEPGFDTPSEIIEAAIKELNERNTKYTRGAGSMELCQSVAEYLSKKHGNSKKHPIDQFRQAVRAASYADAT